MSDATRAAALAIVQSNGAAKWRNGEWGDGAFADLIDHALQQAQAAGLREAMEIIMAHCPHLCEEGSIHASNGVRDAMQQIEARAGEGQ